jgi:hypothetical protein
MLSVSIRESIDDVNQNYGQYAQVFPELKELTTVARLMGLCSWLFKAQPSWLDLDELLAVELPPIKTEVERTQLIAATFFSHFKEDKPNRQRVASEATVIFISPILDQTVTDYFGSPSKIAEYLNSDVDARPANHDSISGDAGRLFRQYQHKKVREMLNTKRDVELLASYAAGRADVPLPAIVEKMKTEIADQETALSAVEASIERMKNRINAATTQEDHNDLVDKHNQLIDQHEVMRKKLNAVINRYNSLQSPYVVEIGGGISLDPSKFAIRQSAASAQLDAFINRTSIIGVEWTDVGDSKRWIKSDSRIGQAPIPPPVALTKRIAEVADQVKRWVHTDTSSGSWRAAVRLDASRSRETSYDAAKQTLQVASFTDGQLQALFVAQRDAQGHIVFKRGERRNVLPPQNPPVWSSQQ